MRRESLDVRGKLNSRLTLHPKPESENVESDLSVAESELVEEHRSKRENALKSFSDLREKLQSSPPHTIKIKLEEKETAIDAASAEPKNIANTTPVRFAMSQGMLQNSLKSLKSTKPVKSKLKEDALTATKEHKE